MIDIENRIIDGIQQLIRSKFQNVAVHSTHMNSPPEFPCVMVYETSNSTLYETSDECGEHHAELRYVVEVYTNDIKGKKLRAKTILNAIDAYMIGLGFFRASKYYTADTNESTIFAATCTYGCVAGESYSGDDNQIMIYRR